jgi:type VI secretion system secreted protein Hcp
MKKKHKLVFGPLALGLCAVPTDQGLAAFDAFIKIDGVPGESSDASHKEWIEIESFHHGVSQPSGGVQSGTTNGWLKVTKEIDKSSPILYACTAGGSNLTSMTLTVRYPGGTNQVEYMQIKLTDLLVSSYQTGGGATDVGSRPTETFSFNFSKIQWTYQPVDASGAPSGPPIVTSWGSTATPTP